MDPAMRGGRVKWVYKAKREDERLSRNYGEWEVKDRGSEGVGWLETKYFS